MLKEIKYACTCCGKVHEDYPALAYLSPMYYDALTSKEKENIAKINDDFCVIQHPENTDYFIRCIMRQKIIDSCEYLEYGLWVSLSEKSFIDYGEHFNDHDYVGKYFGWLSNEIPEYAFDISIPMNVVTANGNQRPEIFPHDDIDHPFVHDYYNGITMTDAEKRVSDMMERLKKTSF